MAIGGIFKSELGTGQTRLLPEIPGVTDATSRTPPLPGAGWGLLQTLLAGIPRNRERHSAASAIHFGPAIFPACRSS